MTREEFLKEVAKEKGGPPAQDPYDTLADELESLEGLPQNEEGFVFLAGVPRRLGRPRS